MNDYELRHYLKTISENLEKQNKDNFFQNLYDGVLIGVVSGLIQALILRIAGI